MSDTIPAPATSVTSLQRPATTSTPDVPVGRPLTAGRATITDLAPIPSESTVVSQPPGRDALLSSIANANTTTSSNSTTSQSSRSAPAPTVPAGAPVGNLVFTQPSQGAVSYYKIAPSETITFGWSFTNLLIAPTSLTLSAGCDNGGTYPVGPLTQAPGGSGVASVLSGNATQVEWDIYGYQMANPGRPLGQAVCTLTVHGGRPPGGATAVLRRPGQLEANMALAFALYTPESYVPLSEGWRCAVCNTAVGSASVTHPIFASLAVSFLVVVLSGFHLLRSGPLVGK